MSAHDFFGFYKYNLKRKSTINTNNAFFQNIPGAPCAAEVMALIDFLAALNFPVRLTSQWAGNYPCKDQWFGLSCEDQKVSVINLPNQHLNGKSDSLRRIQLKQNNITSHIPACLADLKSLTSVDLSYNNFQAPLPEFIGSAKIITYGNPSFTGGQDGKTTGGDSPSRPGTPSGTGTNDGDKSTPGYPKSGGASKLIVIVVPIVRFALLVLLAVLLSMCFRKKEKEIQRPSSYVVHPRDLSDSDNMVKIVVTNGSTGSLSTLPGSSHSSINSVGTNESHTIEALHELQSEIAVLSKVRYRHLVSLLGYSIEGNERLLVYEYMPQGDLSKHLFQWDNLNMEPLSWKTRLNIALDVARGMDYLHNLARESFIHRDLKSSDILLGDDYLTRGFRFWISKTFIGSSPDVFSFGVVLMELVTGLRSLDESRSEETGYSASWLRAAVDRTLEVIEERFESICIITELAGHCTAREPHQRPVMIHAVNTEECSRIDYNLPLNQMVKGWKELEDGDISYSGVNDNK
ncbi:hypothetical protein MKW92_002426 [Papaver armeniacum]|nr:hypothetical protein MKW92_002426 [Papaver armeniacum]